MYAENQARTTPGWLTARPATLRAPSAKREPAFRFVQSLAAELSRGRIDLPTSPDVAQHMQHALGTCDLSNTAVMRMGPGQVRSAALPYVMEKIRSARAHAHLGADLARLWERSTRVAAIARLLAERTQAAAPDAALLAGLLHNLGAVYLLARSHRHIELFSDPATREMLMHDWQAPIGKAIAQNWGLPDEIADAIGDQDQLDRPDADARDLTGVLCVAVRCAAYFDEEEQGELAFRVTPLCRWLGLDRRALLRVMAAAAEQTAALRAALSLDP